MNWSPAFAWIALILFALCVGIVAYFPLRDRRLRGIRISNREINRERVTITLPNWAMRDFKERK